jgi:hypothetical protein
VWILIRIYWCAGWSGSTLFAHAINVYMEEKINSFLYESQALTNYAQLWMRNKFLPYYESLYNMNMTCILFMISVAQLCSLIRLYIVSLLDLFLFFLPKHKLCRSWSDGMETGCTCDKSNKYEWKALKELKKTKNSIVSPLFIFPKISNYPCTYFTTYWTLLLDRYM